MSDTPTTDPSTHDTPLANIEGAIELTEAPSRHPTLWFLDGSIVLHAEQTLFRVHISQLSRHSVIFKDMFSIPQPATSSQPSADASSESNLVPPGCCYLRLHDPAEDLAHLLAALYDGPVFGNNDCDDFRVLSGLLRLSTKYAVDKLRRRVVEHLSAAWPRTLVEWDAREEAARAYEADTGKPRCTRYPSPMAVINLARAGDAPDLLPSAFYDLSRHSYSQIFGPASPVGTQNSSEVLTPTDMQHLVLGEEASQQAVTALIRSLDSLIQREQSATHPGRSGSGYACAERHQRKASLGRMCKSAAACRQDLTELVALATQHYVFDRAKGCADPLYVAEELGQLKSAEAAECRACAAAMERWAARERERVWRMIPRWFHLEQYNIPS